MFRVRRWTKTNISMDADTQQKYTYKQGVCIPLLQLIGDQVRNKSLTTREVTQYFIDNGAHYVCTVKGNQPNVHEAINYCYFTLYSTKTLK